MNTEELERFELLTGELRQLIQLAYFDAKEAHSLIFKEELRKQIGALAYLNKAVAGIMAAKSLYFSNFDILAHNDIEDVFNAFDTFSNEILSNFSTDHSHQWTDIEFSNFVKELQSSVFAISNI